MMYRCRIHRASLVSCLRKQKVITKRGSSTIALDSNWLQSAKSSHPKSGHKSKTSDENTVQSKVGNFIKSTKQTFDNTKHQVEKQVEVKNTSSTPSRSRSSIPDSISIIKELFEKELLNQNFFFSHHFTESHPFISKCSNIYQTTPQVILDHIKLLSEGHCIQSIICLEGSELTVSQLLDFCERLDEALKVEKQKERYFKKLGSKVRDHMRLSYAPVNTYLDFAVQFPTLATEDELLTRHSKAQSKGLNDMITDIIAGFTETNEQLINSTKQLIGSEKYRSIEEAYQGLIDILAYRITTQSHLRSMVNQRLNDVTLTMADERVKFSELIQQPFRFCEWKASWRFGEQVNFEAPMYDEIKQTVYDTLFSQCEYQQPHSSDIKMILDKAIELGVGRLFQLLSNIKWDKSNAHAFLYNAMEEDLKRLLLREKFEDTVLALDSYAGFSLAIVHPKQGVLYTKEFSKYNHFSDSFFLETIADLTKQFRVKLVVVNNIGTKSAAYAPLLNYLTEKYPRLQQRQHTFNKPSPESALYKYYLPRGLNEISLPGRKAKTASPAVANAITLARVTLDPFEYVKYPELLPLGYYRLLLSTQDYKNALLAVGGTLFVRAGVDINTATQSSLSFVGMSATLAKQFLTYREKAQGFRSKTDLAAIPTIPSQLASIFVPMLRIRDSENAFDECMLAPKEYRYAAAILNACADVTKIANSNEDQIIAELANQLNLTEHQVTSIFQRLEFTHDYETPLQSTPNTATEPEATGSAPVVGTWSQNLVLDLPLGYVGISDWRYSYKAYPIGAAMQYKVERISPKSGRVKVSFPKVDHS